MNDGHEPTLDAESPSIPLMSSTNDKETESDDDNDSQSQKKVSSSGKRWIPKWKVVLEAAVLIFFLLFLWAVYAAVPTVFYVLKPILQVCMSL